MESGSPERLIRQLCQQAYRLRTPVLIISECKKKPPEPGETPVARIKGIPVTASEDAVQNGIDDNDNSDSSEMHSYAASCDRDRLRCTDDAQNGAVHRPEHDGEAYDGCSGNLHENGSFRNTCK